MGDREVVLQVLKRNGRVLRHASLELKGKRAFAQEAVSESGRSLWYAHNLLKGDEEEALEASKKHSAAPKNLV